MAIKTITILKNKIVNLRLTTVTILENKIIGLLSKSADHYLIETEERGHYNQTEERCHDHSNQTEK